MNNGKSSKLIPRSASPLVLEYPFAQLDANVTTSDEFFVRDHFDSPIIDAAQWRLKIEGAVDRPVEWSLGELHVLPTQTRQVTLECAGNGRSLLDPKKDGLPWHTGAVGNATWTGVPLSSVLERAGVSASAVDVIFEGADAGEISKGMRPPGKFNYSRSISIAHCTTGDLLLATQMNGRPLLREHGFPLRLIVPGWYGMASVKWLKRIIVSEQRFEGFFQTIEYATWTYVNGVPTRIPLSEMLPKAQIARPAPNETISAGQPYRIHGAAWSGGASIENVEISTDGGATWSNAKLLDAPIVNAWRLFELLWNAPQQPGNYTIRARATDARGRMQPPVRDQNLESYVISHVMPVDVIVL